MTNESIVDCLENDKTLSTLTITGITDNPPYRWQQSSEVSYSHDKEGNPIRIPSVFTNLVTLVGYIKYPKRNQTIAFYKLK